MKTHIKAATIVILALITMALTGCAQPPVAGDSAATSIPRYQVDTAWPKPLQGNWIFGQVSSVTVDQNDHVWVLHRPRTLLADEKGAQARPPANRCCTAAPPVVEFDADGNYVRGWGGPGEGYDWPAQEHGIHVDAEGFVWISGNDDKDRHLLKFTREGRFVLQIGKPGKPEGSSSTTQLGRPAAIDSDLAAGEIYIGDGYGNHRVIVFDAATGTYKRHWGAYGGVPDDGKQPPYRPGATASRQFGNPHCVHRSRDGLLYVCDRPNNRIQVFEPGGRFLREFFVERDTLSGPIADLALSRDTGQRYIFSADGANSVVHILSRTDGRELGSFGRPGRQAGEFRSLHNIAIDSKGNLYTAEAGYGRRVQKFSPQ
jgi:sugar lactone lactonase YvrE